MLVALRALVCVCVNNAPVSIPLILQLLWAQRTCGRTKAEQDDYKSGGQKPIWNAGRGNLGSMKGNGLQLSSYLWPWIWRGEI